MHHTYIAGTAPSVRSATRVSSSSHGDDDIYIEVGVPAARLNLTAVLGVGLGPGPEAPGEGGGERPALVVVGPPRRERDRVPGPQHGLPRREAPRQRVLGAPPGVPREVWRGERGAGPMSASVHAERRARRGRAGFPAPSGLSIPTPRGPRAAIISVMMMSLSPKALAAAAQRPAASPRGLARPGVWWQWITPLHDSVFFPPTPPRVLPSPSQNVDCAIGLSAVC